jgi:hypothetical protein
MAGHCSHCSLVAYQRSGAIVPSYFSTALRMSMSVAGEAPHDSVNGLPLRSDNAVKPAWKSFKIAVHALKVISNSGTSSRLECLSFSHRIDQRST